MTVAASEILNAFEKLPPEEQFMVRQRVVSLTEERQREALNRLRGASAGKHLLAKLLVDRAGERARG